MGMYASIDDIAFEKNVLYEKNPREVVPLWVEISAMMLFVMGAILWGVRSRSKREIPE